MKKQTTINLEDYQLEFIKKFDINLSSLMRKKVDELIKQYKTGGLIE